jgi:hypothetical protein
MTTTLLAAFAALFPLVVLLAPLLLEAFERKLLEAPAAPSPLEDTDPA